MESLFILIPIAIAFVTIALAVFFWCVKSGQFEDLDTEGKRILFEQEPQRDSGKEPQRDNGKEPQRDNGKEPQRDNGKPPQRNSESPQVPTQSVSAESSSALNSTQLGEKNEH